jgi:DNA (cytosine-5)-methyltransferase 1
MKKHYSLSEAAEQIGISAITLKRWLLQEKVNEVSRDRNGWRIFTQADIRRIREYAERIVPPKTAK